MPPSLDLDAWIDSFKNTEDDHRLLLARRLIGSPDFAALGSTSRSPVLRAALDFDGGSTWLRACLGNCDVAAMGEAIDFGLTCGFDQATANLAFVNLLKTTAPHLHGDYHQGNGLAKTAQEKASVKAKLLRDGKIKKALWTLAIQAGAPLIGGDFPRGEPGGSPTWRTFEGEYKECGLWALQDEALRGGALDESSCWLWSQAGLLAGGPSDSLWDGNGALGWASERGLDIKSWPAATFRDRKTNYRSVAGNIELDANLARLMGLGARILAKDSMAPPATGSPADDPLSLMGALLESEISPAGIATAAAMGARVLDPSADGASILETLFALDAAGLAGRARALLAAADMEAPGGASILLGRLAKDGSGPMHWAAQALCAEAIELFAAHGVDVHARDASGRTPGHLAAKRYGAKNQKKVEPTLRALGAAGFDWASLDKKGVSALAALSAKGPIEPLADIVRAAPAALAAKGKGAAAALGVLAKRGGAALAAVESAVLSADEPSATTKPARKRRL